MAIMRCCVRSTALIYSLFTVSGVCLLLQNETSAGLTPLSKYVLHPTRSVVLTIDCGIPASRTWLYRMLQTISICISGGMRVFQ